MVYRDMTFCTNKDCPFGSCIRHNIHTFGVIGLISESDFTEECETYQSWKNLADDEFVKFPDDRLFDGLDGRYL